jgi:hypothetical protein
MASVDPSAVRLTEGNSGLPPSMNRNPVSPGSRSQRLASSGSGDAPTSAPCAETSAANEGFGESSPAAAAIPDGLGAISIWCSETESSVLTAYTEPIPQVPSGLRPD